MKIKIDGKFYNFFDEIAINYKLDSVASVFSFKARFNPDNKEHKSVFKPLQFKKVEIYTNDNKLRFTGVIVNTDLSDSASASLQNISGYSTPGKLEDCTIPFQDYPLEKNNVTLTNIAEIFLKSFDVPFVVDESAKRDMELEYIKTSAGATETFKAFISKLASQRNIILGHTPKGELRFFKPNFNQKAKHSFNRENTLSMSLKVKGQAMHSHISVIRQSSVKGSNITPADTVSNRLVGDFKRPTVKILSSGIESATKKAANNILASELRNISLSVNLHKILDLECGDTVEVINKHVFLYEKTTFVISEISISENVSGEGMSLSLVLPETYTGEVPKLLF